MRRRFRSTAIRRSCRRAARSTKMPSTCRGRSVHFEHRGDRTSIWSRSATSRSTHQPFSEMSHGVPTSAAAPATSTARATPSCSFRACSTCPGNFDTTGPLFESQGRQSCARSGADFRSLRGARYLAPHGHDGRMASLRDFVLATSSSTSSRGRSRRRRPSTPSLPTSRRSTFCPTRSSARAAGSTRARARPNAGARRSFPSRSPGTRT